MSPLDPETHYPIAHTFVSILSLDLLHLVRGVSHAYRELCDAVLAYQLVVISRRYWHSDRDSDLSITRGAKTYHGDVQTRTKHAAPRVPGLRNLERCISPEEVPEAARRVLALVRVLDIKSTNGFFSGRISAEQQWSRLFTLCVAIAPHLTRLETVRVNTTVLPDKVPFIGKTLVLWAQRDHPLVIPTFTGFEHLVINLFPLPSTRFPPVTPHYPHQVRQVTLQIYASDVFGYFPCFDESGEAELREVLLSAVDTRYLSQPATNFAIVIRSILYDDSAKNKTAQDTIASCMRRCIPVGPIQENIPPYSLHFVDSDGVCNATELFWDVDYCCRPLHTFFKLTRVIDPPVIRALSRLERVLAPRPRPFSSQGTCASPIEPALFVRARTKSHRLL